MSESAIARSEPKQPAEAKTNVAWSTQGAQITSLDEAWRFAALACKSGLVPKALDTPEKCFIALQCGMELGFAPFQSLQSIHVIDGKPSLPVEVATALVESGGYLEPGTKLMFRFVGERGKPDWACIAWSTPRGGQMIESEPVYFRDFGHLHAKDNWKRYPERMMKSRAVGYHVRDFYAGAIRKLPFAEERMDMEDERGERPMRDVTPRVSEAMKAKLEPAAEIEVVEPCAHPEGFSADGTGTRVCIACGAVEEPAQGSLV